MSNQNELDKILSDFKVPKREVTLDEPEAIKKPVSDEINDAVNFDYLAYTDNIKLDKPINMSNPDVNKFNSNPTKDTNFSGCNFSRLDKVQLQVIINQKDY